MGLRVIGRPSQGGETLDLVAFFFEDTTIAGLEAQINASASIPNRQTATPVGESFLAEIQYRTVNAGGNMINYSVMIIVGQWNPT